MKNISAIILAAGKGTRMHSHLPKVMHKIANKPMLGHVLANIKPLNLSEEIVVIGPEMADVEDYVRLEFGNARCAIQHQRNGSAGAVMIGLEHVQNSKNDILVMYGDHPLITSATIEKMYDSLRSNDRNALVLISFIAADPAAYGRVVVSDKNELERIIEFLECTDAQKETNLCNSGIMLIRGNLIRGLILQIHNRNAKREYYLTCLVSLARNSGYLCQHVTIDESEVMGVNSRADLVEAEKAMQRHLGQKALAAGVSLIDPRHVHFSADTILEQDVIVHPYVVFGPGVEVKSGAEIKSFSHIEGATIGKNAKIGPYARIRPGTEISENARIGNFVEIKNSKIAATAKINHLSYIGDTTVGAGANIGAGTITCNYDGINKYQTEIESGAFIGSNTALVAPVKIGANAIIAAGSVISKNVPAGALAVARTDQKNIEGKAEIIRRRKKKSQTSSLRM